MPSRRALALLVLLTSGCLAPADDDDAAANDDDSGAVDDDDTAADDDDSSDAPPDVSCTGDWDPDDFATVYEVGPGQSLAHPNDVPWESLAPSTLVRIHPGATAYATKFVIVAEGTEAGPIVVTGVPDAQGNLPVLTGDGATTRLELDYWNERRSVIKVGGSSSPSGTPAWVYVERLVVRSAHPSYSFTDDAGSGDTYADNAAAIHLEDGHDLFVRGNELTDSGNGLFSGSATEDVTIACNSVHGNGIVGSFYEHNSYTETRGILFEGNRYGSLRPGADGNNLKDRSSGTVIRFNWIEDGNRQLDLVDSGSETLRGDADYRETWVVGNVLVEPDGAGNSQIIHYGGDSGDLGAYRAGTLHLVHNTVVSTRAGNTTLVRLSSAGEQADIRNNILAASGNLAIVDADGDAELRTNWLQAGWVISHSGSTGTVQDLGTEVGTDPGFVNAAAQEFGLAAGSANVDAAGALGPGSPAVNRQYVPHQQLAVRPADGAPDRGAFEAPSD